MKRTSFHRRAGGFNLIELLVVIVVLGLIGFSLLPPLRPARNSAPRINCVNNLKQVGLSFRLWAGDHNDKFPMQVSVTNGGAMELANSGIVFPIFQVMSNELNTPIILKCPSDTNRIRATNFTTDFNSSKVSYFVGLDADETNPQMLLAGDRNIMSGKQPVNGILTLATNDSISWTRAMHQLQGNVALADGSVQQLTTPKLREALHNSGAATNRLALP